MPGSADATAMAAFGRGWSDDEGFSLVELLVVVIVIGILAAIAIPSYWSHQAVAHDANVVTVLRHAVSEVHWDRTEQDGYDESFEPEDYPNITLTADIVAGVGFCIVASHDTEPVAPRVWNSTEGGLQPPSVSDCEDWNSD